MYCIIHEVESSVQITEVLVISYRYIIFGFSSHFEKRLRLTQVNLVLLPHLGAL